MTSFRDRLLLVTVAFLVLVLGLCYFFLTDWLGLTNDAQILVLQTFGLVAFAGSVRRTSPWRRRKLRLRWPLIVTSIGLLLAHAATVGAFVILYHPRWRGPHWSVVTVLELAVFGVALSCVDEYCTLDRRPKFSAFLVEQMRIATGHIDSEAPRD